MPPSIFRLKVARFDAICQFELSWGQDQCLTARLNYPAALDARYQEWQQAYLNFYQRQQQISEPVVSEPSPLRARVVDSGSITPSMDWQAHLIDAETPLLREFRDWLWCGELRDISKTIAAASRQLEATSDQKIDVFLTCDPLDLVRLPWETWEITDDLAATGRIRIVRCPSNMRAEAVNLNRPYWQRARILAICCDDVGLNLSREKQILKSLEPLVYVKLVGWSTKMNQTIEQVRQEIVNAIEDEHGWDILFFAGHSNETQMNGGRLAIAPAASFTIEELKPHLTVAKNHGLQLAMFNSCSGLSLAESLVDLGLNQVVVMRERIHNQVAQEFLVQFARSLAAYKDVHESVRDATQLLLNKRIQYPSAYLVPSVFRRPGAPLFQLSHARRWLAYKLVSIFLLSMISLLAPVQLTLLDQRLLVQSWYRQLTQQVKAGYPAELALVRVDNASIQRDQEQIGEPYPISRTYMSRLVDRLSERKVKVVGIDYLFDFPDANSPVLAASIRQATDRGTRFVFAKTPTLQGGWLQTPVEIADPRNVHADAVRAQGDDFHMPQQMQISKAGLPISYWLAWLHRVCIQQPTTICQSDSIDGQETEAIRYAVNNLPQLYELPLSSSAYGLAGQLWFRPITDFSLPPEQIYTEIPAWKLLYQPNAPELSNLSQQTALIASGGYKEAGLLPGDGENFAPPAAMAHWYKQKQPEAPEQQMTGGEHIAYLFSHFLHQRFVMPIPDLWLVLLAAIAGKAAADWTQRQLLTSYQENDPLHPKMHLARKRNRSLQYCAAGTLAYALFSLQLYVSSFAILLPIVLPTAMFWSCMLPLLVRRPRS